MVSKRHVFDCWANHFRHLLILFCCDKKAEKVDCRPSQQVASLWLLFSLFFCPEMPLCWGKSSRPSSISILRVSNSFIPPFPVRSTDEFQTTRAFSIFGAASALTAIVLGAIRMKFEAAAKSKSFRLAFVSALFSSCEYDTERARVRGEAEAGKGRGWSEHYGGTVCKADRISEKGRTIFLELKNIRYLVVALQKTFKKGRK